MTATPETPPVATFTKNAICRQGPGTVYETITSILQGESLPVVGRNQDNSWWLVQTLIEGKCWVSDSTVTLVGSVAELLVVPAPPTPTPSPTPSSGDALDDEGSAEPPATPGGLELTNRFAQAKNILSLFLGMTFPTKQAIACIVTVN